MTPTARTLAELRKDGYLAAVVEKWNPHAKIRQDLFGCVDVLGIREGETIAVQATSGGNVASRVKKMTDTDALYVMRKAGWTIQVWGWRKGSNGRWALRKEDLS